MMRTPAVKNHERNDVTIAANRVHGAVGSLLAAMRTQRGQGMVEYGLILVLVAVAVIGTLLALSGQLGTVYNNITNGLAGGNPVFRRYERQCDVIRH